MDGFLRRVTERKKGDGADLVSFYKATQYLMRIFGNAGNRVGRKRPSLATRPTHLP